MKILVIEDDKENNNTLCELLQNRDYETESAYNGVSGVDLVRRNRNEYKAVLLDLNLPYKSGESVLKEIREVSDVPVIIISGKDTIFSKIELLKLGADDYITKPYDIDEVLARMESVLRRSTKTYETDQRLSYKDLILDTKTKTAWIGDKEIELRQKEYQILELMLQNPTKVFSKINLYQSIWGEEYLNNDNTLNSHLYTLRTKLKQANPNNQYIETIWGMGFRLYKN